MTTPMKVVEPSAAQAAARDDMIAVLRRHEHLRPDELLAVSSYFVGQLLALQDQRTMTPEAAMDLIKGNIEAGNAQAIQQALGATSGSA